MKTDEDLLVLAAKAAGLRIDRRASFMTWRDSARLAILNVRGGHTLWNPLEDDGDALRLAVKLGLNVDVEPYEAVAYYAAGKFLRENATMGYSIEEATRRAIVRAAAEIGARCTPQPPDSPAP